MKSLFTVFFTALIWLPLQQTAQPPASPPGATPTQTEPQAAQQSSPVAKPPVKHVHVAMEGFELDKKSDSQAGNAQSAASRGAGPTVFLYAPQLTKLYTLTPTFCWKSGLKTKAFFFRLFDADGEVTYENHTPDFRLQYPASAPPLEPGTTYIWTVQGGLGLLGGGSLPVHFIVLNSEERAALEKQLAGAGAMKRAAIFTDKRLWYDAIQAYTELIAQHPDVADLYEKRGNIYDQIPATQDLAQADFEKVAELRAKK